MHSGAGRLTEMLYNLLKDEAEVHVIPTLGQHVPHTPEENRQMFGSIPNDRIHAHDWRGGCVDVGEIPAAFVKDITHGAADWPIPIVLNRMLMEGPLGLIINVGHVVPHEVLGFANHNKNYFIGLGGKAADLRRPHGGRLLRHREQSGQPDHAGAGLLQQGRGRLSWAACPTSTSRSCSPATTQDKLVHTGVYVGDDLETYLGAARQSREQNITVFDEPVHKIVCVMQGDEFFSTWVANKSVYRTRMALADGGELIVIAPGLKRFGEQPEVDAFIRKYGYVGTQTRDGSLSPQRRHAGPGPRHRPLDPRLERRTVSGSPTPRATSRRRKSRA